MKNVLSIVFNELTNDNRVINQAESLQKEGYLVTILAILDTSDLPLQEFCNGVKVIRIPLGYKTSGIYRIRGLRYFYHQLYLFLKYYQIASSDFDFIHCHDLNTLQYGARVKFFKRDRVKLIYDAHEYETEVTDLHGWRKTYEKLKERLLIKFCDRVITVSNSIAEEYVRLYRIEKPVVVLNCPVLRTEGIVKKDLFREKFGIATNTKILLYQGGMFHGRGINIILETFDQFSFKDLVVIFMGEGELTNKVKSHAKYGESVFHHPYVSGDVLLEYTSSADIGLSFGEDICLSHRYSLPNKMFEFIAAGLPVIGSAGLVEAKELLYKHQVGLAADTDDVEGLAKVINNLPDLASTELKDHLVSARAKFNWKTQEKKLIDLYSKLSKK